MTDVLRWGVLGCASIARRVVPAIAGVAGNTVAAVASRSLGKARAFAADTGVPRAFGSYAEMLASGAIDVVYNPLPNALHAEWTIHALERGLPVLCEKPFTVNAAEARMVIAAARRTGLTVAEAFMYRHHPLYAQVARLVAESAIGELRLISGVFTFALGDPSEIPASAELGGGSLRDVGCYPVNLARLVTGAEPTWAFAMARFDEVDHTLAAVLEFPGGVVAQVASSIESEERAHAEILGTRGAILLDSPWFPGDGFTLVRDGQAQRVPCATGDGYVLEVEDFARAVRTGTAPRWPAADALANMVVLDAILESARTGRAVELAGPR